MSLEMVSAKEAEEKVIMAEKKFKESVSPKFWIRGSDGKRSASLTFAVVAFIVSTLWVGISAFENLGSVKIRPFDPAVAGVWLTPVLMLYFGRRATDSMVEKERVKQQQQYPIQKEESE